MTEIILQNIAHEYPGRVMFSKLEAAKIIGVGIDYIEKAVKMRRIEAARIAGRGGGEWRIAKSEVIKLLSEV